MRFEEVTETIARVFEGLGVAIIVFGAVFALVQAIVDRRAVTSFFEAARLHFGRPLIFGLEILVAADVIDTVTVDRSLESVAALGVLVLIRVVLSVSLEVELEGVLPWRRAQLEGKVPTGRRSTETAP